MPIQITISGDTAIEALMELRGLSSGLSRAPVPTADPAPDTRPIAEEVPAGEERAMPDEQPKRRGRPPKAKSETVEAEENPDAVAERAAKAEAQAAAERETAQRRAEAEASAKADAPALEANADGVGVLPADDEKPFTTDDARAALTDLLAQPDGKTKAKEIFERFKATRLSDLAEGDLKGFIAAIAKARGL